MRRNHKDIETQEHVAAESSSGRLANDQLKIPWEPLRKS
jgi:hypothetical protein